MRRFKPTDGGLPRSGAGATVIAIPDMGQPMNFLGASPHPVGFSQFNLPQKIGLLALCVFILTSSASDITLQVLKTKTYFSWLSYPLLILAFAFSGRMLRGLESRTGKCWLIFLVFAVLGIPLSYWPHGSLDLLWGYFIKAHVLFFLICAFVEDYTQCRRLIHANIIVAVMMLFSCVVLGGSTADGRFIIPGSYLFNNANGRRHLFSICSRRHPAEGSSRLWCSWLC